MLIYNVTTQLSWSIHDEWIAWLQNEHLPEVSARGLFVRCQVVRLLDVDDADGPTYAVQYYATDKDEIDRYKSEIGIEAEQKERSFWGDRLYSFSTIMEVIN